MGESSLRVQFWAASSVVGVVMEGSYEGEVQFWAVSVVEAAMEGLYEGEVQFCAASVFFPIPDSRKRTIPMSPLLDTVMRIHLHRCTFQWSAWFSRTQITTNRFLSDLLHIYKDVAPKLIHI